MKKIRRLFALVLALCMLMPLTAAALAAYDGTVTAPAIRTDSLPNGIDGEYYAKRLKASSNGGVTWSVTDGALPTGLALDPAGLIFGTPLGTGTFRFKLCAMDGAGLYDEKSFTLKIYSTLVQKPDDGQESGGGETEEQPVYEPRTFEDVPEGSWFYDAVTQVCGRGLFNGVDDTHFDPDGTMTRGMFLTVLYRAAGSPKVDNTLAGYADVSYDSWFREAAVWASLSNIARGRSGVEFGADDPVTREQIASVIQRYIQTANIDVKAGGGVRFADEEQISSVCRDAVSFCASIGLIKGYPDGTFNPSGNITRAESLAIFLRLLELK